MKLSEVLFVIGTLAFATNAIAVSDAEVLYELTVVAEELGARLPLGNASAMIVSTVVGPGRKFTYVVASHLPASQWTEEQKARHRKVKRELYCSDQEMKFFLDRSVTVVFTVIDERANHIDDAATSPGDCN